MPAWLVPLLSLSYWFESYPSPFAGMYFWIVVGIGGGSFVVGMVFSLMDSAIKEPSTRKIINRLGTLGATFGALVMMTFFFTQTSTPTLGSRFWFLVWLIMAIVWLVFILKYAIKQAPRERAERAKQMEYRKYLPH